MNFSGQNRYRYKAFEGTGSYRRYIKEENVLQQAGLTYQENNSPAHGAYGATLFTLEWKAKRAEILVRDDNSCVICKSKEALQVHHRQYHFIVLQNQFKQPWEYPDELLITLCESCHKREHNKFKVPTINI